MLTLTSGLAQLSKSACTVELLQIGGSKLIGFWAMLLLGFNRYYHNLPY